MAKKRTKLTASNKAKRPVKKATKKSTPLERLKTMTVEDAAVKLVERQVEDEREARIADYVFGDLLKDIDPNDVDVEPPTLVAILITRSLRDMMPNRKKLVDLLEKSIEEDAAGEEDDDALGE
jgi:hypothetical protein